MSASKMIVIYYHVKTNNFLFNVGVIQTEHNNT